MNENETSPESASPAAPQPEKIHLAREWKYSRRLLACRIERRGRFIFTGGQDNHVVRWHFESGERTELPGHESWVRALAFLSDGQTLLTGGCDGRLMWWPLEAEKPQPERTIEAHQGWVRAVAVSPDGQQIATCGNDNLVRLWSAADGSQLGEMAGHERHVYNVAFHPAGGALASFDLMGVAKHWSLPDGALLRTLDGSELHGYDKTFRADIGGARAMGFTPDGKYLACAGITAVTNAFAGQGKPAVLLFGWEQDEAPKKLMLKENFVGTARGLVCHPAGFILAAMGGHGGGMLGFFRPGEASEFFKFKLPNQVHDLALAPDGISVATAHDDGSLRVYSMSEKPA